MKRKHPLFFLFFFFPLLFSFQRGLTQGDASRFRISSGIGLCTDYYGIIDRENPDVVPAWNFEILQAKRRVGIRLTKIIWYSITRDGFGRYPPYYVDNLSIASSAEFFTLAGKHNIKIGGGYAWAWAYDVLNLSPGVARNFVSLSCTFPVSWLNFELRGIIPLDGSYDHTISAGVFYQFPNLKHN